MAEGHSVKAALSPAEGVGVGSAGNEFGRGMTVRRGAGARSHWGKGSKIARHKEPVVQGG